MINVPDKYPTECHSEWNTDRVDETNDADTYGALFFCRYVGDVAEKPDHHCESTAWNARKPKNMNEKQIHRAIE